MRNDRLLLWLVRRAGTLVMSLTIILGIAGTANAAAAFDPFDKSLGELERALDSGELTSAQLVDYYLDRIDAFDRHGPRLNALVAINPQARQQAEALDVERRQRGPRSPLHGIPFVVKDNFDVVGFPTTAGSVSLKDVYPHSNAFVVQKLLDAGAILLGKANMTEFATSFGRPGYSSMEGATLNPYDLTRTASGSSSGPAVAVAANLAAFALGTDTEGSVRGPASVASLVGLRPTLGLLSRSGILPLATTFDTPGPLTRTPAGTARVLNVIAGVDQHDDATLIGAQHPSVDYLDSLDTDALSGVHIGLVTNFGGANDEVDGIVAQTVKRLRRQGAQVDSVALPDSCEDWWSSIIAPVQNAEFKPDIERYLAGVDGKNAPKTLEDIVKRCEANNTKGEGHLVNPDRVAGMKSALDDHSMASPRYHYLVSYKLPAMRRQLEQVMDQGGFDALLFATLACPPAPLRNANVTGYQCHRQSPSASADLAAVTGFSELTLPAGYTRAGLPVGISLLGRPFSEHRLLRFAATVRRAHPIRHPPRYAARQLPRHEASRPAAAQDVDLYDHIASR